MLTTEGGETKVSMTFRGVVYSKFKSIAAFSDSIGWTRQKGTNIVNGITEPSLDDVDKMAKALGLPIEEPAAFFLNRKSQV